MIDLTDFLTEDLWELTDLPIPNILKPLPPMLINKISMLNTKLFAKNKIPIIPLFKITPPSMFKPGKEIMPPIDLI